MSLTLHVLGSFLCSFQCSLFVLLSTVYHIICGEEILYLSRRGSKCIFYYTFLEVWEIFCFHFMEYIFMPLFRPGVSNFWLCDMMSSTSVLGCMYSYPVTDVFYGLQGSHTWSRLLILSLISYLHPKCLDYFYHNFFSPYYYLNVAMHQYFLQILLVFFPYDQVEISV